MASCNTQHKVIQYPTKAQDLESTVNRQRIQENVKIIVHNMAFIQHTKISIKTQLLNQKRESIFQKLARYHLIIVIYRSILVHKFRKLEKIVKNN